MNQYKKKRLKVLGRINQYKKKRLKVLGKINHNNKYRYHRNPSLREEEVLPMGDILHVVSVRRLPECHEDILSFAKKRNPINHPVVMFRKGAVFAAGGYQHFPLFEDYYLWVRMLMNGAKFYNI